MRAAFALLDKDGDGFLSSEDLAEDLKIYGTNSSEIELQEILNEVDINHDGKIDYREFDIMMRKQINAVMRANLKKVNMLLNS